MSPVDLEAIPPDELRIKYANLRSTIGSIEQERDSAITERDDWKRSFDSAVRHHMSARLAVEAERDEARRVLRDAMAQEMDRGEA